MPYLLGFLPWVSSSGSEKWESEDKAQYEDINRRVKTVREVYRKEAYYFFESHPVDEALRIMREHELPYLPVVDSKLRVIGTVRMRDLMLGDEDHPHSGG